MADLSFTFDPAQIVLNQSKASDASSAAALAVAKASDASSAAKVAQSKASEASVAAADGSNAMSKITARSTTWDKASTASSVAAAASNAASSMGETVIRSIPGAGSKAVHEIMYTGASAIKYVYSSVAA